MTSWIEILINGVVLYVMLYSIPWMTQQKQDVWWPCDGVSSVPESNFVVNLFKLSKFFTLKAEPFVLKYNLTFLEIEILASLRNNYPEPMRPSDIYKNLLVSSGGTTKGLKELESRGYIDIFPDEKDRRSKLLALKPAGKELVEKFKEEIMILDRQILEPIISQQDLEKLAGQLYYQIVEKLPNN